MEHTDYFKLQAKNLLKDYKTRFFIEDEKTYGYHPIFFDVAAIFTDFGFPDEKDDFKFSLMNAQHVIAKLAGISKWNELMAASESDLTIAHRQFDKSVYKLKSDADITVIKQKNVLPAPQNLYSFIVPILGGFKITFSFDAVEYAQSYLIYGGLTNDISMAKPLASGQFSPITYVAYHQRYAPYYWVRAFDGKEYGEWSAIAGRNR